MKRYKDIKVNDTIKVEYGCYGNYVDAIVKHIARPYKDQPQYDYIVEFTYTIPYYTGDKEYTNRFVETDYIK